MEEIRARKRKRRIIGFSILGGVIVLIIVLIIACSSSGEEKVSEGEYKQIEKRTIANSVSANGKIASVNGEEVTSQRFGSKVNAVYVKEGDTVVPGQVICQFDTSTINDQINQMRRRIAEADNERVNQDENYDRRVNEANANRQRSIDEAQRRLDNSRLEYIQALSELDEATKAYSDYMSDTSNMPFYPQSTQLQSVVDLKRSNAEYKQSQIYANEAALRSIQESDGLDFSDAREAYNDGFDDSVRSMEEQLSELERSLGESTVRCTVGGTVTELNVKAGDTFAGGKVCSIEGLNDLMVEAEVGEYDIPDVAVGMKVLMKTEGTRDAELTGFVTYVSPKASNSGSDGGLGALSGLVGMDMSSMSGLSGGGTNSSATYLVKISLNEQNPRLRLGMNAKVSIITESVENAVSVPYDSVMDNGDGSKYIEIATNYDEAKKSDGKIDYEKKKVNVTTGIKGSYYIQVFGDVKVGDYVYVPPAEGADSIDEIMNMMGSGAGV